ncbi:f-box only protein [Anaeramoeba ignava]|uniref:F-box only protein n=1 Tax=Anaeramoeba ignava TaxID=1746090 RepID=A0A9Q0LI36_ANAIG|nr:f-box only protein [Anaeramoeba ignava]
MIPNQNQKQKQNKTPYYQIIETFSNISYNTFLQEIYPSSKANKMISLIEKNSYNYNYYDYDYDDEYDYDYDSIHQYKGNRYKKSFPEFTNKNVDLYSNINLNFIENEKEKEKEDEDEDEDENEDYFDWLPEELILMIFEYLDKPSHLCICEATCSQFQRISNEPILWRNVLRKTAPYLDFLMVSSSVSKYATTVSCYFSFKGVIGICKYFEEEYERLLEQQKEENYFDKKEEIEKEEKKEEKKPIVHLNNDYKDSLLDPLLESDYDPNYQNQISKPTFYQNIPYDRYSESIRNLEIEKSIVRLIENNPKKLIVQQINKFESAYRLAEKGFKFYESHHQYPEKVDKALKIFEEGVVPILFSLSFLITIILSMLKLDLIIETNCIYIFIPVEIFLCCLLYIGFCFYFMKTNRNSYHLTISMIISIISTIIFLILLSIKLEYSNSFPWFIILIPHLTSFGAWIYFPIKAYRKIRDEEDYLINIIISYILIFHIPITIFMILFILYKQKYFRNYTKFNIYSIIYY